MIKYFAQLKNCTDASTDSSCLTNLPSVAADSTKVTSALSILFGALAAIAVLIIIIQGIKFVLSQGDPQKAADARKGIIYAVVGLVIALSAEAVVRLVIGRL